MRNANVKQRITDVVKKYLEKNHGIKKKHIEKILLFSDMDGWYIGEEYIIFSPADKYFRYEDDGIYTNRCEDAIERNKRKSRNLNIISSVDKVYDIQVETYYFSCNLDHVLYDVRN